MSNLWVFGDSFSTPLQHSPFPLSHSYKKWKGYYPPIFSEIIANELGMGLKGYGLGGGDNNSIFSSFIRCISDIKEDDIILIGWTHIHRFRMVDSDGWVSVVGMDGSGVVSEGFKKEMITNRMKYVGVWAGEVEEWISFINFSFPKSKILHWTWDECSEIRSINRFSGLETIREETGGEIDDSHYSERGHLRLSQMVMKKLGGDKMI